MKQLQRGQVHHSHHGIKACSKGVDFFWMAVQGLSKTITVGVNKDGLILSGLDENWVFPLQKGRRLLSRSRSCICMNQK